MKANGGQVLGSVRAPLNSSDFSSFILQAQASKAQVVGLANAGADTINTIKTAAEFGLMSGGTKLAGLLVLLTDIHTLGLKTAQGLMFTNSTRRRRFECVAMIFPVATSSAADLPMNFHAAAVRVSGFCT